MESFASDLLSGSISGGVGMLFGHPLDTVKVRMQRSPERYSSTLGCFTRTLKLEGFGGLFKGVAPPLLSVSAFQGVAFASFGFALRMITDTDNDGKVKEEDASSGQLFVAGSLSGAATVLVTTPTDLLKIRLQIRGAGEGGGLMEMRDAARAIYRIEGTRGFFRWVFLPLCLLFLSDRCSLFGLCCGVASDWKKPVEFSPPWS